MNIEFRDILFQGFLNNGGLEVCDEIALLVAGAAQRAGIDDLLDAFGGSNAFVA